MWRPRPASLLTKKHIKDIKKNLKKFSVEFEARDAILTTKISQELMDKRKALYDAFQARTEKKSWFQARESIPSGISHLRMRFSNTIIGLALLKPRKAWQRHLFSIKALCFKAVVGNEISI